MAPPDWKPLEIASQRPYMTLAAIFSSEGVNIASGEEETGRSGQGVEEEKLSGPALAVLALAALVLATMALAAPLLVALAMAAPEVWEMVAPVLTGPSVWNENENPAGSAVATSRQ
jgi:hypothetical protein